MDQTELIEKTLDILGLKPGDIPDADVISKLQHCYTRELPDFTGDGFADDYRVWNMTVGVDTYDLLDKGVAVFHGPCFVDSERIEVFLDARRFYDSYDISSPPNNRPERALVYTTKIRFWGVPDDTYQVQVYGRCYPANFGVGGISDITEAYACANGAAYFLANDKGLESSAARAKVAYEERLRQLWVRVHSRISYVDRPNLDF